MNTNSECVNPRIFVCLHSTVPFGATYWRPTWGTTFSKSPDVEVIVTTARMAETGRTVMTLRRSVRAGVSKLDTTVKSLFAEGQESPPCTQWNLGRVDGWLVRAEGLQQQLNELDERFVVEMASTLNDEQIDVETGRTADYIDTLCEIRGRLMSYKRCSKLGAARPSGGPEQPAQGAAGPEGPVSSRLISVQEANAMGGVALPVAKLRKFNSDLQLFPSFIDEFRVLVHEREGISDLQRHKILRDVLEGDAARFYDKDVDLYGDKVLYTTENYTNAYFLERLQNAYLAVHTDAKRVNNMFSFNGKKFLEHYGNQCRKVEGTNGQLFPAFEEPPRSVKIFIPALYKPWPLYLQKRYIINGEPVARYGGGSDLLSDTGDREIDKCFCLTPTHVKGTFDGSRWKTVTLRYGGNYRMPVVLSLPHFLHGDDSLYANISGLHPDEKRHQFYIDVHARSGLTVDMRVRVQVNMRLIPLKTEQVPKIIFPIFWTEDANLPSGRDMLLDMLKQCNIVCWLALAMCLCSHATSALLCGLLL